MKKNTILILSVSLVLCCIQHRQKMIKLKKMMKALFPSELSPGEYKNHGFECNPNGDKLMIMSQLEKPYIKFYVKTTRELIVPEGNSITLVSK